MRLAGKVAIVTGGGTGIGEAIAKRFAREGAKVAISGRRQELIQRAESDIKADGGEALAVAVDSATEDGVRSLFEAAGEAFGPIDILVNNAAIAGPVAAVWEQEYSGWEETLRINLSGPWLCSREAAKQMMAKSSGKIINIGSISGKRPLAKRTPYTTTKMGLVGLTRTLALELGEFNINVNCISPGAVATPRLEELAQKGGVSLDQLTAGAAAAAALKRISESSDIASLALFLATDDARNITGLDITVDAGVWYQ